MRKYRPRSAFANFCQSPAQCSILLLPIEIGRLADPLSADHRDRRAFVALLDDERLLRVRKFARLYSIPLLSSQERVAGNSSLKPFSLRGSGHPGSHSKQTGGNSQWQVTQVSRPADGVAGEKQLDLRRSSCHAGACGFMRVDQYISDLVEAP